MKEIGERLKGIRKSKGLSQVQMAEIFEIGVSAYSKLETGVNELTVRHLLTLKDEFKISSDWLLTGESGNSFGKYSEDVHTMLANMKSNRMMLHSILCHYYGLIDKALPKLQKKNIRSSKK